jgi:transposase
MIDDGLTPPQIAARSGLHIVTVYQRLRKYGIEWVRYKRPRQYPELADRAWFVRACSTMTSNEIAAEVGCSRRSVWRAAERHGVCPKPTTKASYVVKMRWPGHEKQIDTT